MFARFVAVVMITFVSACADGSQVPNDEQQDNVETSNTGQAFFLEPEELSAQMELAKAGDNEAAIRISEHYSLAELQHDKELPWLIMAAERGHVGAMRSLGYRYGSGMYQITDCRKAVQWLERAKKEGSPSELEKFGVADLLNDITQNGAACQGHEP